MVFLKEFFKKVDIEKHQQTTKSMKNYPVGKESKWKNTIQVVMHKILQENYIPIDGPQHNKICLRGFLQTENQTSLLSLVSYRD